MTDVAMPVACGGGILNFYVAFGVDWFVAFRDQYPAEEVELFRHAYVNALMRPMWGALFTGEKHADDD